MRYVIKSASRASGTAQSFKISLKEGIYANTVELLSATIPLAQYNIDTTNNGLLLNDGTNDELLTIASGCYSATTLAAAITHTFALGTIITATFDTAALVFTISSDSANFIIKGTDAQSTAILTLGYEAITHTGANAYTAPNMPRISEPYDLYINLNSYTGCYDGVARQTFVLPITGNSGTMLNYSKFLAFEQKVNIDNSRAIKDIDVALITGDNTPYSLNGLEWMCVVDFS